MLCAARVVEDVSCEGRTRLKFIGVRYNGFAPARLRPYSFTLPPRYAFGRFSRAAGEGWKVRATFPTLFRRRGRFTIYLHASKVCEESERKGVISVAMNSPNLYFLFVTISKEVEANFYMA